MSHEEPDDDHGFRFLEVSTGTDDAYELDGVEILGFLSGLFLAVSLIPQVSYNLRAWSTGDISYSRQIIYLTGLWMMCTYFFLIDALAGWVTLILEILVGHALLFLKFYIDGCDSYLPTEKQQDVIHNRVSATSLRTGKHIKNDPASRGPRGRGRPNVYTTPLTTVRGEQVYRCGFHFAIDASYDQQCATFLPIDYGPLLLTNILTAANKNCVGIVHDRMEIFPMSNSAYATSPLASVTPSGFAIVLIFANSQLCAHCNADAGTLALDCFARGSSLTSEFLDEEENQCLRMMESIVAFLMHSLGHDASVNFTQLMQYPDKERAMSVVDTDPSVASFASIGDESVDIEGEFESDEEDDEEYLDNLNDATQFDGSESSDSQNPIKRDKRTASGNYTRRTTSLKSAMASFRSSLTDDEGENLIDDVESDSSDSQANEKVPPNPIPPNMSTKGWMKSSTTSLKTSPTRNSASLSDEDDDRLYEDLRCGKYGEGSVSSNSDEEDEINPASNTNSQPKGFMRRTTANLKSTRPKRATSLSDDEENQVNDDMRGSHLGEGPISVNDEMDRMPPHTRPSRESTSSLISAASRHSGSLSDEYDYRMYDDFNGSKLGDGSISINSEMETEIMPANNTEMATMGFMGRSTTSLKSAPSRHSANLSDDDENRTDDDSRGRKQDEGPTLVRNEKWVESTQNNNRSPAKQFVLRSSLKSVSSRQSASISDEDDESMKSDALRGSKRSEGSFSNNSDMEVDLKPPGNKDMPPMGFIRRSTTSLKSAPTRHSGSLSDSYDYRMNDDSKNGEGSTNSEIETEMMPADMPPMGFMGRSTTSLKSAPSRHSGSFSDDGDHRYYEDLASGEDEESVSTNSEIETKKVRSNTSQGPPKQAVLRSSLKSTPSRYSGSSDEDYSQMSDGMPSAKQLKGSKSDNEPEFGGRKKIQRAKSDRIQIPGLGTAAKGLGTAAKGLGTAAKFLGMSDHASNQAKAPKSRDSDPDPFVKKKIQRTKSDRPQGPGRGAAAMFLAAPEPPKGPKPRDLDAETGGRKKISRAKSDRIQAPGRDGMKKFLGVPEPNANQLKSVKSRDSDADSGGRKKISRAKSDRIQAPGRDGMKKFLGVPEPTANQLKSVKSRDSDADSGGRKKVSRATSDRIQAPGREGMKKFLSVPEPASNPVKPAKSWDNELESGGRKKIQRAKSDRIQLPGRGSGSKLSLGTSPLQRGSMSDDEDGGFFDDLREQKHGSKFGGGKKKFKIIPKDWLKKQTESFSVDAAAKSIVKRGTHSDDEDGGFCGDGGDFNGRGGSGYLQDRSGAFSSAAFSMNQSGAFSSGSFSANHQKKKSGPSTDWARNRNNQSPVMKVPSRSGSSSSKNGLVPPARSRSPPPSEAYSSSEDDLSSEYLLDDGSVTAHA